MKAATCLANASNQSAVAQYEYGPFGETIRSTGSLAKNNPFRFSTKYQDDESDLFYYGHRYYKAATGAWLSRDPNDEQGGLIFQSKNLMPRNSDFDSDYSFAANSPIDNTDYLGFESCSWHCGKRVDLALIATYIQVVQRYNRLSFWGKVKARAVLELPINLVNGWDLDALTWYWDVNQFGCGGKTCQQTATVGNGCYNVWSINYIAYGWGCNLTGISMNEMLAHIFAWKIYKHDWEEADQWTAFAVSGYYGVIIPPPQKNGIVPVRRAINST